MFKKTRSFALDHFGFFGTNGGSFAGLGVRGAGRTGDKFGLVRTGARGAEGGLNEEWGWGGGALFGEFDGLGDEEKPLLLENAMCALETTGFCCWIHWGGWDEPGLYPTDGVLSIDLAFALDKRNINIILFEISQITNSQDQPMLHFAINSLRV